MPPGPLPPGVVARLGSTAYRLDGRYGTVFLLPPHFRSYVASDGGDLREYDLATGVPGRVILPTESVIRFCGISADGKRIAVHTPAGYQVRRVADQHPLFTVSHGAEGVGSELSANGRRLAVLLRNPCTEQREADRDMEGCYVRAVAVHTVGPRSKQREFRPLANYGVTPHLSHDGRYLAVTGEWEPEYDDQPRPFEGATLLQVWDVASGREVFRVAPSAGERDLTPQLTAGVMLVTTGYPARPVALYDLASGDLLTRYRSTFPRGHCSRSPDGRLLGTLVEPTQKLVVREARTGRVVSETSSPFGPSRDSSFSANFDRRTLHTIGVRADGTAVVLQSVEQSVLAWSAPDGVRLSRIVGGSVPAKAVVFTANGREVITTGAEPVIRRWDAATGELLREIKLPKGMADRMALVHFDGPERLVADSAFGGADFDLKTRKARLTERISRGERAWGEYRSTDGWLIEFWADNEEDRRMSRGTTELRVGRVGQAKRRTLTQFQSDWYAATADRGRVLLAFDERGGAVRKLMGFRVSKTKARQEWERTLTVGREFRDAFPYDPKVRIDTSMVAYFLAKSAILWSPDGATALVIPQREQVPFLIDPDTGETLHQWTQAIRGPHAVHPHLPLLATGSPHGNDLLLLDWRTGERRAVLLEQCYPHALAWSPDGTRLVASVPDGTAYLFAPALD